VHALHRQALRVSDLGTVCSRGRRSPVSLAGAAAGEREELAGWIAGDAMLTPFTLAEPMGGPTAYVGPGSRSGPGRCWSATTRTAGCGSAERWVPASRAFVRSERILELAAGHQTGRRD
jgi:hypothetical protein